jgi:hypothetical protein
VVRNSRRKTAKENTVPKDVVLWEREEVGQQSYRDLGLEREHTNSIRLLAKENNLKSMKGILVALLAIAAITGIVTTGFAIAENKELPNPNVSIHMDYEVIRDDGVVVVHYSDGSKLFKAGMEDGVSTNTAISKQIETQLEDKVTVVEKLN